MATLITNISSLVTVNANGGTARTGASMNDVGEIKDGAILFDETIEWIGRASEIDADNIDADVIDAQGCTVMPGFVDSHTHMVFAGSRSHEFARRLQGVSYQTIAAEGGGILSTMRAVREADLPTLLDIAEPLVHSAMQHGTTTVEIKSGYGLTLDSELRQLAVLEDLREMLPITFVGTFLGAHDVPPEYAGRREAYVDHIINDMLPRIAEQRVAEFCDVFADTGYFTNEDSERILRAAATYGLKAKVHADELTPVGAAEMAARVGAVSADHLLHISEAGMEAMKAAGTVATLLPGTAYTLRLPYAPARAMIDRGMVVALATDCNPGSCFCENMQQIMSLACMNMRMSIEESIVASTLHGAAALGLASVTGSLEVGKRADIVIHHVPSYTELVYHFGTNTVMSVFAGGQEVA